MFSLKQVFIVKVKQDMKSCSKSHLIRYWSVLSSCSLCCWSEGGSIHSVFTCEALVPLCETVSLNLWSSRETNLGAVESAPRFSLLPQLFSLVCFFHLFFHLQLTCVYVCRWGSAPNRLLTSCLQADRLATPTAWSWPITAWDSTAGRQTSSR